MTGLFTDLPCPIESRMNAGPNFWTYAEIQVEPHDGVAADAVPGAAMAAMPPIAASVAAAEAILSLRLMDGYSSQPLAIRLVRAAVL
jgi:hypothetical protein